MKTLRKRVLLKSPVRKIRTPGSVRGLLGNWQFYRNNMGKKNNQAFVSIPHAQFIDMLAYKCVLAGIEMILTEESYTSKTSFLDLEPVKKHDSYMGRRVKRGMFVASMGRRIHADINGSYNMIRKVLPDTFSKGIVGVVVAPIRFSLRTHRAHHLRTL